MGIKTAESKAVEGLRAQLVKAREERDGWKAIAVVQKRALRNVERMRAKLRDENRELRAQLRRAKGLVRAFAKFDERPSRSGKTKRSV